MPILAIEETFGASEKIERDKSYLEKTYPELNLPATAIMLRGNKEFNVDLNGNPNQHLEAYITPFRIPKVETKISSYVLNGSNGYKVNVVLWYKPRRPQKEVT